MKQGIKEQASHSTDIIVEPHGSISLFRPLTQLAKDWMAQHCPADGEHQYFGGALVVEHRFVRDLIHYALNDGLSALSHL